MEYQLEAAPGSIRMGDDDAEWEPAEARLTLHAHEIGPSTVACIDIAAWGIDGKTAAGASIEITIEDIEDMIATLSALREDAITNRGFALRADGFWGKDA